VRYLILSDIHSNLQALDAVLAAASRERYDAALVLGDLVGYAADPSAVIARTCALRPAAMIRGNHDRVCAGLGSAAGFSDVARQAIEWTAATLSWEDLAVLAALPEGPREVGDGLVICHGAPFDEDHYILGAEDARRAMAAVTGALCLFGHTHWPAVFASDMLGQFPAAPDQPVRLAAHRQWLVNVGSVGQPRDGDPRAAYGLLDTAAGHLTLRRVEYDIAGAQERILGEGLPRWLADRLALGR
jgi:diadenosine tetraphosphatase ApaH/serine/threonine PP2A family protein phosphatase